MNQNQNVNKNPSLETSSPEKIKTPKKNIPIKQNPQSTAKSDNEEYLTPKKKPTKKIEAIKTFCRIRPINKNGSQNELFSISQNDNKTLNINSSILEKLNVGNNLKLINSYKFSKIFDENSTQEEVFQETCQPLIEDLIQNQKSGLIFTYGMTNAGKTFTVIGSSEKPGILPRALKNLLEIKNSENNLKNIFYCNFVEIYNEEVFDLLSDDPTGKNKFYKKKLNIKENLNSIFYLQEVTYAKLENLESFNTILNKGINKKVHSSTNLNQNSSRSHTIFKIIVTKNENQKFDSNDELISLSVVDLAGSERQKRTDAKGKNLQEACKINQSLSTLGKCLEAMKHNSNFNQKKIVPLRESKLTKIFAEYFRGEQNVIMITNINPRTEDFEETIRALNYSCIAKEIKPVKSIIPRYNNSSAELKLMLKREKNKIGENNNIDNNEIKKNFSANSSPIKCENKFNDNKKNNELNEGDSITLNINEFFDDFKNDKNNFDNKNDNFNENEQNTKNEIAKLVLEIQKLREEIKEVKPDNSIYKQIKTNEKNNNIDINKNNINDDFISLNNSNSSKDMSFLTLKNINQNFENSNIPPPLPLPMFPYMKNETEKNNINNNNNSHVVQEINKNKINNNFSTVSNMLTPYNPFNYPFNNPFYHPFNAYSPFGYNNMINSNFQNPFLALPDPNENNNQKKNCNNLKGNCKNKKITDMIDMAMSNYMPSRCNSGVSFIFINSKFGNLKTNQPIEEESEEDKEDDFDSVPLKKKIKKKGVKNNRARVKKEEVKKYPLAKRTIKSNKNNENEKSMIKEKNEEKNDDKNDISEEDKQDSSEN